MSMMAVMDVVLLAAGKSRMGKAPACYRRLAPSATAHRNFAALWNHRPCLAIFRQDRKGPARRAQRSEEHTSELQSLMRISYAVFCLKKKKKEVINRKVK